MKKIITLAIVCIVIFAANAQNSDLRLCRIAEYINSGQDEQATAELNQLQTEDFNQIASCRNLDIKRALQYIKTYDSNDEKDQIPVAYLVLYVATEILLSTPEQAVGYLSMADSIGIRNEYTQLCATYLVQRYLEIGSNYNGQGNYSVALNCYNFILSISKKYIGKDAPMTASALSLVGFEYYVLGQYQKSEECLKQELELWEKPDLDPTFYGAYAQSMVTMGILQRDKGNYSLALQYGTRALELYQILDSSQSPDYSIALNSMGALYAEMGDYTKALDYCSQALQDAKSRADEDMCGEVYLTMGSIYHDMSDFKNEELYTKLGVEQVRKSRGDRHPDYASALNNLGLFYKNTGDYDKAEQCYLQALDIWQSTYKTPHPDYAKANNHLGWIYMLKEEYDKAERCYEQAYEISQSALGEEHRLSLTILNNQVMLYRYQGKYAQAEKYALKALKVAPAVLGQTHDLYATLLNNTGLIYLEMRKFRTAEPYLQQADAIYKAKFGEQSPDYAMTQLNLGLMNFYIGNKEQAKAYYTRSAQIYKNTYIQTIAFMTERQRAAYWNTINVYFERSYPSLAYKSYSTDKTTACFAYNNELFRKGMLLQSVDAVKRSVMESGDKQLIRQWDELTEKKQQIITLEQKNPGSEALASLRAEAEQLEKAITQASAAYRESQAVWQITWESVRNALKQDQVAIEFFTTPLTNDSTKYVALLLRHDSPMPELIPLFEQQEAEELISRDAGETYNYDKNGKDLSELVWKRVLTMIKPGETVYFAPAGLLHQLAIEALPYDEERTMGDVYNLVRLSSTRELVLVRHASPLASATLYGGIRYDTKVDQLVQTSRSYGQQASRALIDTGVDRGGAAYLPGTKEEIEQISKTLGGTSVNVQMFTAEAAVEESFKALSGKHQGILHIATHGFFWSDTKAKQNDLFAARLTAGADELTTVAPVIDPLDRCGLLMAGANTALQGHSADLPEGVQDGILTAKEISLLDLRDAAIVVLSACETGKGEVSGEGVFGLQRAFKMAGAQTIIMSLWPVSDAATQLLMTEFYHNWITLKQSKREAFRNAQNAVRNYTVSQELQAGDKSAHQAAMGKFIKQGQSADNTDNTGSQTTVATKRPYQEPHYWAGFVMLD